MIAHLRDDPGRPAPIHPFEPGRRAGLSFYGDIIMADYHSPTVVQPTIPNADITPLERLLLTHVFEAEPDGDGLYFFAETGPSDLFDLTVADLRAAVAGIGRHTEHRLPFCRGAHGGYRRKRNVCRD